MMSVETDRAPQNPREPRVHYLYGLKPGREVGEAYRFLLETRLDEGPLGTEEATARLKSWWAARQH